MLGDAASSLIINILGNFPLSPFQFDEYLPALSDMLGYINYFIPFYLISTIMGNWLILIAGLTVAFLIYKLVSSKVF